MPFKLVAMTAPQLGFPDSPYGPGAGQMAGPAEPPGHDLGYAPPPQRRNRLATLGTILTALIAAAALAVGIVALLTRPGPGSDAAISPTSTPSVDTSSADRALCTAIAPLMAESDRISNSYVDLGSPGTPARDAATPKFITDILDWVGRIQPVVDQHTAANPFFLRSLQRFIDDQHLIVVDLAPGPLTAYAKNLFSDGVGAYSGPLHICDGLGIKW